MESLTGCPWGFLPPSVIDFCEADRCGWVVEPVNSLSNLAFMLCGIYIWRKSKRDGAHGLLKAVGPICALIGVFSVALHATMTQTGQFLDLASMYLLSTMVLFFNYRRMRAALGFPPKEKNDILLYVGANAFLWLLHGVFPKTGVPAFALMVVVTYTLEIILWRIQRRKVRYFWLWMTAGTFGLSLAIWSLDIQRIWCEPMGWLQGHALWHCGCALAVIGTYNHFRQFVHYSKV